MEDPLRGSHADSGDEGGEQAAPTRVAVKAIANVLVPIPYDLMPSELILDPAAVGSTMDKEMSDLNDHYVWDDEEEMYHVFLATVLLYNEGAGTLGECLATAKIWWRG